MRIAPPVLATLLAVSTMPGCAGGQEATVHAADEGTASVHLGARDDGRRLELRVGRRFTLALRANFSTGFAWKVVSSGEPVLRRLGEPAFTEDSHKAGAGGTLTYEFRAEEAGTATLALVYVREWEKDAKPAATFTLTVVVTK